MDLRGPELDGFERCSSSIRTPASSTSVPDLASAFGFPSAWRRRRVKVALDAMAVESQVWAHNLVKKGARQKRMPCFS